MRVIYSCIPSCAFMLRDDATDLKSPASQGRNTAPFCHVQVNKYGLLDKGKQRRQDSIKLVQVFLKAQDRNYTSHTSYSYSIVLLDCDRESK